MSKLVCIQTFATRIDAALTRSLLEANGIKACVSADDVGGLNPEIGFTSGGTKLFVLEEDVGAALSLLKDDAGIDV